MTATPRPDGPIAERREVRCPMRDGVGLRTILLLPHGTGPWPALLTRHPYDVTADEHGGLLDVRRLVAAGYLVALQDVRGRFGSEGEFDPCAQEVDDGADAVAWLAALPECTGAVGMWGASYASDTQFAALVGGAPALKAVAATVTPALSALDGFRFRGGVPELGSTLAWTHYAIAPGAVDRIAPGPDRDAEQGRWDGTERAIESGAAYGAGALARATDAEAIVRWGLDRLRAPLDSDEHRAGKIVERLDAVDVPTLLVGGWFDVFLGSTLELYRRLLQRSRTAGTPAPRLIVGPWSHSNLSGSIAGVDFGAAASADELWGDGDLTAQHLRHFDAALRAGSPEPAPAPEPAPEPTPGAHLFLMGSNEWLHLDGFPPAADSVELFLDRALRLADAPGEDGELTFVADPAQPVPTLGGATLLFGDFEAGPVDQAPIEARPDVLSWRSAALTSPLSVVGAVRAELRVTTTGTDADVVVRLCDEHPDGRSLVIADGVQRGSARGVDPVTGRGERRPLTPGHPCDFVVDLWSTAHTFLPGHRLRVDVTSSSAPRWEVGGNSFGNSFGAPDGQPRAARVSVAVGQVARSRLILDVAGPQGA